MSSRHTHAGRTTERGATLAFVAMSMVVVMGMAALSIDLGMARLRQRQLTTATDVAAVTAATSFVYGHPVICEDGYYGGILRTPRVGRVLAANLPSATQTEPCQAFPNGPHAGHTTVSTELRTTAAFVGVLGLDDEVVIRRETSVHWGPPSAVTHADPLVVCINAAAGLRDLIFSPPAGGFYDNPAPQQVDVPITTFTGPPCPGMSDNFGYASLDGSAAPSDSDYLSWIANGGTEDLVAIDETLWNPSTDCATNPACIPYANLTATRRHRMMQRYEAIGSPLRTVLFADAVDPTTSRAHIVGIGRARISPGLVYRRRTNWAAFRVSLQLEFKTDILEGVCCSRPAGGYSPSGNTKVVAICGVDPNETGDC